MEPTWLDRPEEHDFPAAESFLTLGYGPVVAAQLVALLRGAPVRRFAAKDLLRASELPLLDEDNTFVKRDLKKARKGEPLSPLLGVADAGRLVVADGYHRACASYWISERADVPMVLVTMPAATRGTTRGGNRGTGTAGRATAPGTA